jgi:phage terminase large subunit-like protein
MNDPHNWILQYYQQITDGSVIVGRWIRLLYEGIVKGIEEGKYKYDQKKANNAVDWIEKHCFHTIGFLAPGPLKLELWQKALVSCLFGILDPETGKRQFRELVFVVARKNGKSLLASAIAKYVLYVEGGYGARVYCTAPKLDQADIIYDNIWQMITLDPEWQAEEEKIRESIQGHNKKAIDDSNHAKKRVKGITIEATNSLVKKIAFSDRKNDGFDPSLVICDEIASWAGDKGLKQYEVWKSACGAREMGESPSIIISCSTAGYISDSIYDENIKRSTRFLLGESKEQRILPVLYMIDDVEKWDDINELHKSNPNINVSVSAKYLFDEIAVAEGSLSKKAEFIVKYANIKQNSSIAWLPAHIVAKACGEHLQLEDFRNSYCVGGIDLSQTRDLTAAVVVIEKDGELYVFARFWLPSEKIDEAEQRDGVPYKIYIQRGLLFPSGDNFVDYNDCYNWFCELVEQYQIFPLQIGYDRYSADYLTQQMKQYGFHMDDVFQGDNLHGVIQETQGLLEDNKIHIGDNDLLKMHLLNSAIKMSVERGRGKLVKLNPTVHIDGCAALLDAMTVRQKWYSEIGEQLKN